MYVNKSSSSNGSSFDVMNSIEDNDIFNSKFLYALSSVPTEQYLINKFPGRLDLMINEKYGSYDNYGSIYILNRITNNSLLSRGNVIELLDSDIISNLRSSL